MEPNITLPWTPSEWPVLKTYPGNRLSKIALPVGGIGTGTISLGGRGELTDWQVCNVPALGFSPGDYGPDHPSFTLWFKTADGTKGLRALEGPLLDGEVLDGNGQSPAYRAFARFGAAEFDAAYPFGQVRLSEEGLPVRARIRAFNPFIPGDVDASSLPIAVFSYEIENISDKPIEAAVAGRLRNFIGCDSSAVSELNWIGRPLKYHGMKGNRNDSVEEGGLKGFRMSSSGVPKESPAWGTFALTTFEEGVVTVRTGFDESVWYMPTVEMHDDFGDNGELNLPSTEPGKKNDPMASVAVKKTIPAKGRSSFTFFFTWSFPNRYSWDRKTLVGNYYTGHYKDAWEAALEIVPRIPELEKRTLDFVNTFLASSAPDELKEAALFNLATLRSPTVFRIPSGHLMGWEGVMDNAGSCEGSCTHVWNYEQATAYLFPELARTMRDVEFNFALAEDGEMAFRANLPLHDAKAKIERAADGQMGTVLKAYREWKLSGDKAWLDSVWPGVKKALSYAWTCRGKKQPWDGDHDGVMEGPQGNTMDVEYWGPNPQMAFWYLGALKAGAALARVEGDEEFAAECDALARQGSEKVDAEIFNGEYYFQKIPAEKANERFQLGQGCLVDQLVGDTFARSVGLGPLANPVNLRSAIASVAKYNYVSDLGKAFNPLRAYGLDGESGLLMASWPNGFRKDPFPYYSEVMTGFEYSAASALYYEGMDDLALRTVKDVRARHDGARRNPFSEAEAGHHYARSMASWGTYLAWSGFKYDAVTGEMSFSKRQGKIFWCVGERWGLF